MSNRIVRSGPIAPVARGVQAPPSMADRVAASPSIVVGVLRSRAGQGRRLAIDEVLKDDESAVAELATVDLPPFPDGDHRVVVMVARDGAGTLRLTADPRSVEPGEVKAILAAMADRTDADG